MTIRPALPEDVAQIADLAQDQRIRQAGWEPDFWAMAPNAREIHPVFLRTALGHGHTVALVAERDSRVVGYAIAGPGGAAPGEPPTWLVDDIGVATAAAWAGVGTALLAAVAAQARRHGIERIVTPCPSADRSRRTALAAAGLDLNCWYRSVHLDRGAAPAFSPKAPDGEDPGLPLPHLHGLHSAAHNGSSVMVAGAHGIISRSMTPPPVYRLGGTMAIADPVIAQDQTSMATVLDEIEAGCRTRGDLVLVVAVGPGEGLLERSLDERSYRRPLEWWVLRPR